MLSLPLPFVENDNIATLGSIPAISFAVLTEETAMSATCADLYINSILHIYKKNNKYFLIFYLQKKRIKKFVCARAFYMRHKTIFIAYAIKL